MTDDKAILLSTLLLNARSLLRQAAPAMHSNQTWTEWYSNWVAALDYIEEMKNADDQ